jgi:hypothetical protein
VQRPSFPENTPVPYLKKQCPDSMSKGELQAIDYACQSSGEQVALWQEELWSLKAGQWKRAHRRHDMQPDCRAGKRSCNEKLLHCFKK